MAIFLASSMTSTLSWSTWSKLLVSRTQGSNIWGYVAKTMPAPARRRSSPKPARDRGKGAVESYAGWLLGRVHEGIAIPEKQK